jgi:hypothetical protein
MGSPTKKSANVGAQLVVSPAKAQQMLDCGTTHFYKLLNSDVFESFKDGKTRKITVASIEAYIQRKLAEARGQAAAEEQPDIEKQPDAASRVEERKQVGRPIARNKQRRRPREQRDLFGKAE